MAPIPIFCCMLCYMWKTPSRRESLLNMKTLAQLLARLVFSLQEQYCSKHSDDEEDYEVHSKKAVAGLKNIGKVAFHGLLGKQLIFDEKEIDKDTGMTGCEVGVLSKEKRQAPLEMRQTTGKLYIHEFSFPHKLLQEYTSSAYLASLFDDDRPEFNKILTDKLLTNHREFTYVWYFTAARGGELGKKLMEELCDKVEDVKFIVDVAYECHDSVVTIDSVRTMLNKESDLKLAHPFTAFFFTLESLGEEIMRKESLVIQPSPGVSKSLKAHTSSSLVAAVGLFTLQSLQSLNIYQMLDEDFFLGMCHAAPHSKIHDLRMMEVDVTRRSLHGILSLPCLKSLTLSRVYSVNPDDGTDEQTLVTHTSSVENLSVDAEHLTNLWKIGLHASCPRVRKLSLNYWDDDEDISSGFITLACSPFEHLAELEICGRYGPLNDTMSFCNALVTACPGLIKLSIAEVELANGKASEIITSLKTHPHLTDIEIDMCNTDKDLDPLIAEVNNEGKLSVTVKHR